MNLEEKWLWSAKEVCRWLGITARDLSSLVKEKTFPVGVVRGKKKKREWTSKDIEYMRYRLASSDRFQGLDDAAADDLIDEIEDEG